MTPRGSFACTTIEVGIQGNVGRQTQQIVALGLIKRSVEREKATHVSLWMQRWQRRMYLGVVSPDDS